MNVMNRDEDGLNGLTQKVIGCAFNVANALGVGFLEKVYENSLAVELRERGLKVEQQQRLEVRYHDVVVDDYAVDLLVENRVLVELKVASTLSDLHIAQCMNNVRSANKPMCLLINFGRPRIEIRRVSAGVRFCTDHPG